MFYFQTQTFFVITIKILYCCYSYINLNIIYSYTDLNTIYFFTNLVIIYFCINLNMVFYKSVQALFRAKISYNL